MDFAHIIPLKSPSAWLDMDALDHNIDLVNQKTQAVNLRLATKSIRSIDVLNYIKQRSPHFIGLMSYAADESVYLLENGFDNILCAYPSLDMASVAATFPYTKQGATMIWMVDRPEHADLLNHIAKAHGTVVEVCLDINMSMSLPALYFGTKRSALVHKKDIKKLLKIIKKYDHIKVSGVMGYEAQIAGLAERLPDKPLLTPVIRLLKSRSKQQVMQRRGAIVSWVKRQGYELKIVNGGGSGSMDFTASQPEITEITVGSAYYKPVYFDYMDSMQAFWPAAGFVLPVTRQPEKGVITCHSGGFIASGSIGADKAPVIHHPQYLTLREDEGFGEVQTPMVINKKRFYKKVNKNSQDSSADISIGDFVWCRHAKSGELCEHFNELVCYRKSSRVEPAIDSTSGKKQRSMTTYRGAGKCFH